MGCVWFQMLDKYVTVGSLLVRSVQKVVLDQFLLGPIFLGIFFLYNGFLEGHTLAGIRRKLETSYYDVWITGLKLWPTVQLVNFMLVPLHLRIVFAGIVALGWNAFMSIVNERSLEGGKK